MKPLSIKQSLFALSLMYATSSSAAEDMISACQEKSPTPEDISRCYDGIKEKKDRELATWVNNQTFILEEIANNTGRRSALNMFKRSQRNFDTYRENNCRWRYLAISPASGAADAFKECYIRLTQGRINELANKSESG